jgi:hypothetical protein
VTVRHFVEIHAAGNATERHEIVGAEARIGSGPASSIRPKHSETLRAEHVRVAPMDDGCRVGLMPGVAGPLMFAGTPQWEVLVPWGDEVFLDGTRFTFLRASAESKRPSPVLLAVVGVVLALAGVAFARSSDDQGESRRDPEPPPLLQKPAQCPDSDPIRGQALASQAERSALAKEERSAFAIADGAHALALLSEAEACYRAAANTSDAERVNVELRRWTAHLNEDFAATRLRLRMALEHGRSGEALDAVQCLQALLEQHGKEPYTDWLDSLRRELEERIAVGRR